MEMSQGLDESQRLRRLVECASRRVRDAYHQHPHVHAAFKTAALAGDGYVSALEMSVAVLHAEAERLRQMAEDLAAGRLAPLVVDATALEPADSDGGG